MSVTTEQGAHAILQPRAEQNAKILLALWMEHGRIPALDFPTERFPTEPLAMLAENITDALARGRRGWPEILEDTADNAVIQCDEALREHEAKHGETNVAELRQHLGDFHNVKARQLATWRLQAALDKGEDTAPIIAELAALDAEGAGNNTSLTFTHADELVDTEGAFDFVEDVLTDGAASVVYGASNSGKTFWMIDLGAHVATGRDWQEKEVEQGAVLYIALEGTQGAVNRIKAMMMRGILPAGSPFYCCFSPVNLLDPTHPAAVVRMIAEISEAASMPVRLIIIDTMARAMAGGDENSGKDMGQAVETIDAIRAKTAAHVCIIHHCGKDTAKGARGHSSLRAAIDTEIEIIHPEGDKYRTATIVKQRDLPTIAPLCFSLDPVEVGRNRRGKPITSCVVKAEDSIMAHTKGKPGAKQKYTCEMILDLLPQPSVKVWELVARETHGMSADTFGDRKRECASRWENVGNQITVKPLQGKGKWGNGEIKF